MLLDISGNTFSSLGNPQDADVQRFIAIANITSPTEIQALYTLVFNLKQNNIWDKMQAIYPFVGGTSTSTRFNLKDQRDSDAAFRLVFSGSWTYSSTGVRMTTSANTNFIRTFYFPSANTTSNSVHISMYLDGGTSVAGCAIGTLGNYVSGPASPNQPTIQLFISSPSVNIATIQARNTTDFMGTTNTGGYHLANRSASNAQQYYLNGILSGSNAATSVSLTGFTTDMLLLNRGGDRAYYHPGEARFATIGTSLTSGEVSVLYNAIQAFQTTLGRQVGTSATSPARPPQFTLPTVTYNPKQLYGSDLYVWVDLTDWRNMYNTATGSTNIASTGCLPATSATDPSNHTTVRRLEDMAGTFTGSNSSRKFYNYIGSGVGGPSPTFQPPADNVVTGNTNLFCNNILDTNKGIFSGAVVNYDFTHTSSSFILAQNSALTLCNYLFLDTTIAGGAAIYTRGLAINYYLNVTTLGFANFYPANNFGLNLPTTANTSANVTVWSQSDFMSLYGGRVIMLTAVLSGGGYDIYVNNNLITSSTLPNNVSLPFQINIGQFQGGGLNFGSCYGFIARRIHPLPFECFIANSYTSPQQINLLYDYFRVKFKDKQSLLN